MYQNFIKLLQNILFMLLLVISTPILILFALIIYLVEKSKNDKNDKLDQEDNG